MQNSKEYSKKKVTPSFHLETKEYRDLFDDFLEGFADNVIAVGIVPPKTSNVITNKNADNLAKEKAMRLGLKVISIGERAKQTYPEIKLGSLVHIGSSDFIKDAKAKEITVKGVFPALRKYTAFVFNAHDITRISNKVSNVNTVQTEEMNVHKDIV